MDVIFKTEGAAPVALFPSEPGTCDPWTCACYAHVGQHSSADVHYAAALRPAHPSQYADLRRELESIGYDDLRVVHRFTRKHTAARQAALRTGATA